MNFWLDFSTADFIKALKTVKRKLQSAAKKAGTLDISYIQGEAVFCVGSAMTKIEATGHWAGLVETPFLTMLSFIQVPPAEQLVRLEFDGEKVRIGSFRCKAAWQKLSEELAEIKNSIHLNELDQIPDSLKHYCPVCGTRTGQKKHSQPTDLLCQSFPETEALRYVCNKCGLNWHEFR